MFSSLSCPMHSRSLTYSTPSNTSHERSDRNHRFNTRGPEPASVTSVRLMELSQLHCPTNRGEFCSGTERGTCLDTKICQCFDNFRGPACEYDCPMGVNQSVVCSGRGTCHVPDPHNGSPRPVCACASGSLGTACEIDEVPTVSIQMVLRFLSLFFFEIRYCA